MILLPQKSEEKVEVYPIGAKEENFYFSGIPSTQALVHPYSLIYRDNLGKQG